MNKLLATAFFLVFGHAQAFAGIYAFDCKDSKVQGSIKYAVIGSYNAAFHDCRGMIVYNEAGQRIEFVHVQIAVRSVHSQCPWCDKAALSKRLMDPQRYPFIIFKSDDLRWEAGDKYIVKGLIDMHGIAKPIASQFTLAQDRQGNLHLKGDWVLRRKDFNIVWNKVLDHGGVIVGENMTVSWQVNAHRQ